MPNNAPTVRFAGTESRLQRPQSLSVGQENIFYTLIEDIRLHVEDPKWNGGKTAIQLKTSLGKHFEDVCELVKGHCHSMDIDFHKAFLGNNLWEITMIRRAVPTQPMFRETAKPPAERSMALEVLSAG